MNLSTTDGLFEITETLLKAWKHKFSQIDVETEIAMMHLWLLKNSSRRPKNGIRFVETWLKRCRPKLVKMHLVSGKMTESEMLTLGRTKGIEPRAGESWEKFAQRLRA